MPLPPHRPYTFRVHWLVALAIGWIVASIVLSWLVGRWFRWLRGDFDPPPH